MKVCFFPATLLLVIFLPCPLMMITFVLGRLAPAATSTVLPVNSCMGSRRREAGSCKPSKRQHMADSCTRL